MTSKIRSRIPGQGVNWFALQLAKVAGSLIWSEKCILMIPFNDVIGELLKDLARFPKGFSASWLLPPKSWAFFFDSSGHKVPERSVFVLPF